MRAQTSYLDYRVDAHCVQDHYTGGVHEFYYDQQVSLWMYRFDFGTSCPNEADPTTLLNP